MTQNRFRIVALLAAFGLVGWTAPAISAPTQTADANAKPAKLAEIWQASYVQKKTRDDQGEARKEMKAGNQLSLREIEKRILPRMQDAEYLGPAYDAAAHAYRLKFIRDGRVMYVDVDARTGKIINRSG